MAVKKTDDIDNRIIGCLRDWEEEGGEFSRSAGVYRELLQIQMKAKGDATVSLPELSEDQVRARLRGGILLLLFEDFLPDWDQVQAVSKEIIAWAAADSEASRAINDDLKTVVFDPGFWKAAAEMWYHGLSMDRIPVSRALDVKLLSSMVGATLKPFLSAYSEELSPRIDQELWRRKDCPVCGGKPDFSALREGGARWLFCSRCDGKWLFFRMECPYCSTRDPQALAYFTDEEQPGLYRLEVCEACHTYIKGIDSRLNGAEVLLPLQRLCTLNLDRQGREKGYEAGWTIPRAPGGFSPSPAEKERERRAR